jgi:hypothetical protein
VSLPGGGTVSYTYNGLGSRVGRNSEVYKRVGAIAGSPMIADGSATYTPGLSEIRSGTSSFFHFDGGGDLAWQSDGSGSLTDFRQFDWFGVSIVHTGTGTTPIGDNGGYTDPDTGGVGSGGGADHEPGFGPSPSVAPIQGLEGECFDPNGCHGGDNPVDWTITLANGAAGFGDHISCNLTSWIREETGYNEIIDTDSTAYHVGTAAGYVYDGVNLAAGGVGVVSGIREARAAAVLAADGQEALTLVTGSTHAAPSGAGVYVLRDGSGIVKYVGQTCDFVRRQGEWLLDRPGWVFEAISDIADPVERTIAEQLLINEYGGIGGGQLINKINAIAKRSALFKQLL